MASSARFTHPVNQNWVQTYCRKQDEILDYGCGYGRTLLQLENVRYKDLTGIELRHHRLEWLEVLIFPLEIIKRRIIPVRTMSGRPVNSFQVIARESRFAPTVGGLE